MKHLWEFVETAIDVAVPFVAMWIFYSLFLSPNYPDQMFINAACLFVAFQLMRPVHRADVGRANAQN